MAAILAAPDDPTPRMVLADWLEQRGDPRGELIRIADQLWSEPIDLVRARTLILRRIELDKICDARSLAEVLRPTPAEIRRRVRGGSR